MPTQNEEISLIALLLEKEGFTSSRAKTIAAWFDEGGIEEFVFTTLEELRAFTSPTGRKMLKGNEPERVLRVSEQYDTSASLRANWIQALSERFTSRQNTYIENLSLNSLSINPFLVRSLKLKEPEDVVRFNMYQAVTRSVVTSMGSAIEAMVLRSGAEEIEQGNSGFDLKKTVGDHTYWIQVKSGTNTMNADMVRHFSGKAAAKESESKYYAARLGLTYGKKEQVSGQIRGYFQNSEEKIIVGRDLWEFVSGEPEYHEEVLEIMSDVADKVLREASIVDAIETAIDRVTVEFVSKYGDGRRGVDEAVRQLI